VKDLLGIENEKMDMSNFKSLNANEGFIIKDKNQAILT
jgi:hypothetical protein